MSTTWTRPPAKGASASSSVLRDPAPDAKMIVSSDCLYTTTFWPPVTLVQLGSRSSVGTKSAGPKGTAAAAMVPCKMWYSRMLVTSVLFSLDQPWYLVKASLLGATIWPVSVWGGTGPEKTYRHT